MKRQLVQTSACDQALSSIDLISSIISIESEPFGIANFVRDCPNMCDVVAGYANPDLVGIGVSDCLPP